MTRIPTLLCFSFVLLLAGCLDRVSVPIRQETRQLVVEGEITNDSTNYAVRLSFTKQFGEALERDPVRGAVVSITDNTNRTVALQASPTESGLYLLSATAMRGIPGRSYRLLIKLTDGREYESTPEKMPIPVAVERLTTKFETGIAPGYRVMIDFKDPVGVENYYRWTAWSYYIRKSTGLVDMYNSRCCDQCWQRESQTAPILLTDANIDGAVVKQKPVFLSPFYAYGAHYIEVTQHALNRPTYQYWRRYQEQLVRTGSIFDPVPAPILGNVVNKSKPDDIALGYFSATALARGRIVVSDEDLSSIIRVNPLYVKEGDCATVYPFATYSIYPPPGW